jgi:hypothetical protein
MWFEGQLPMDRAALESRLTTATLRLGLVSDTVPAFLAETPSPVAFISFDLDLYSSTVDALGIFRGKAAACLPRVVCYLDDILGHTYNDFCGERLAIAEYNEVSQERKIAPVHGLRHFMPRSVLDARWPEQIYLAHLFDHPAYGELDSLEKAVMVDVEGRVDRRRPIATGGRNSPSRRSALD